LNGEAELASTLIVKRRLNRWYAVFIFELKPREENRNQSLHSILMRTLLQWARSTLKPP